MNRGRMLRSEDTEQMRVFDWAHWKRARHPELFLLHHIPNGGSRNAAEAAKLKAMGVKAGVPDIHLPVPKGGYNSLWIELKAEGGRIRPEQREFLQAAAEYGGYCVVCYGADAAIAVLEDYLNLQPINTGLRENLPRVPNLSILRKDGRIKEL